MKLSDFLAPLATTNTIISLIDLDTKAEIVSFKAAGYANLDDTIESRKVEQWSIVNAANIRVVLGEVIS